MKGKQTASFTYVLTLEEKPQLARYERYICIALFKVNTTEIVLFRRSVKFCVTLPSATRERENEKNKTQHACLCMLLHMLYVVLLVD